MRSSFHIVNLRGRLVYFDANYFPFFGSDRKSTHAPKADLRVNICDNASCKRRDTIQIPTTQDMRY
jgi:hypothetical protein